MTAATFSLKTFLGHAVQKTAQAAFFFFFPKATNCLKLCLAVTVIEPDYQNTKSFSEKP